MWRTSLLFGWALGGCVCGSPGSTLGGGTDADGDADADVDVDGDGDGYELGLGGDGDPWNVEDEGSPGVVEENGGITLGEAEVLEPTIWIPNAGDATVTKVDTRTWEEEGRYRLGASPTAQLGGISTNLSVDVVVSASIDAPRVTRVNLGDCGAGATSASGTDVRDWGDDACVVWSTIIPTPMPYSLTTVAWEARRTLDAIEPYVWAGDAIGHRVIELDGDGNLTGRTVDVTIETAGIAVDADDNLWVGAHGAIGILTKVDPVEAEVVDTYRSVGQKYDCIAADADGKIWITGLETTAAVFDQETEEFTDLEVSVWGAAVDAEEYVWFGGLDGLIYRMDRATLATETFDVGFTDGDGFGGATPYTAVDVDGNVWAVEPAHEVGIEFPPENPLAYEGAIDTLTGPGACGDMTGTQLLFVVTPVGTYRHVFEGCPTGFAATWDSLRYDAFTPGGSAVRFDVRAAETLAELADAEWIEVGVAPDDPSPLDLSYVPPAALLEVQLTLMAGEDEQRPLVREIGVSKTCVDAPE
jgi:hypothetical protein